MRTAAARTTEADAAGELERIYREHAARVLSAAYRVTGSPADAEDVLQTVFLRLSRRRRELEPGSAGSYLHRAAINAALDLVRSRRVRRSTALEEVDAVLAAPGAADPEQEHRAVELRAVVRRAVAELSPKSAEIFALRYFEGFDNDEISRMTGTSRGTVAVILHRGRQRVRETIRPYVGATP